MLDHVLNLFPCGAGPCVFGFEKTVIDFKNGGELAPSLVGWSPARLGGEWSLVRVDCPFLIGGVGIPREVLVYFYSLRTILCAIFYIISYFYGKFVGKTWI